jgi:hypothetical protein
MLLLDLFFSLVQGAGNAIGVKGKHQRAVLVISIALFALAAAYFGTLLYVVLTAQP